MKPLNFEVQFPIKIVVLKKEIAKNLLKHVMENTDTSTKAAEYLGLSRSNYLRACRAVGLITPHRRDPLKIVKKPRCEHGVFLNNICGSCRGWYSE